MKVLFYTGHHKSPLSLEDWQQNGGTQAIDQTMELAQDFARNGHDVTVGGDVESATHQSMTFCSNADLVAGTHFDLVIAASYIHYVKELETRGVTWDKSVFVAFNHHHFPWWRGEQLHNKGAALFHDPRMTWVVTQSETHKRSYLKNNPGASKKARVIGQALDASERDGAGKVPGRFVLTTDNPQTRARVLNIWPAIRSELPGATLSVIQPKTSDDLAAPELDGVTYLGAVSVDTRRAEIAKAEFWLNPTTYAEEFSLTALEMMAAGVKVISTTYGNLSAVVPGHGWVIDDNDDEDILKSTFAAFEVCHGGDAETVAGRLAEAKAFAATHNRDDRYADWQALIEETPKAPHKYPELYTYFDDKKAWAERFISYAARTKEWELVVDEPFDNCFSFPLFTDEFCRKIREEAEYSECWTTDRHHYYPTTDMLLQVLGLDDIYKDVIAEYVMPCARTMWELPSTWDRHTPETFLAKYTAAAQGHLSLHHDNSDLTCLIQLSDMTEYEGGGTFFVRQKKLVKNDIGYATLHPGNITHRHGGRAISKGLRYILVSFITRDR